jgi:hypothetical protein
MKRVLLTFITFASALLVLVPAAAAQQIDSPYRFVDRGQRVGIFGGHVSTGEDALRAGPQDGPIFGARWALRVSGPFSLGAEVAYMPTTRTVRDTAFVAADSLFRELGEANMRLVSVMGNMHFSVTGARTWHSLQPFVVLGGGVVIDLAGTPAIEAELPGNVRYDFGTSFAGQLGGGVEWFPSQQLSVRVDARNVLWRLTVPEAYGLTTPGARLENATWENNFALTAGLSFYF